MLYNPWSASRCFVFYVQTFTFLTFLLISCSTFRITYGFSAALLGCVVIKGLHLHAIYKGTRSMVIYFYRITIFTFCITLFLAIIIMTLAICSFYNTESTTNTIQNGNMIVSIANSIGSGFIVGVVLFLVGFQFLDTFFQSLYVEELNYKSCVSGAAITLERVGRIGF